MIDRLCSGCIPHPFSCHPHLTPLSAAPGCTSPNSYGLLLSFLMLSKAFWVSVICAMYGVQLSSHLLPGAAVGAAEGGGLSPLGASLRRKSVLTESPPHSQGFV